MGSLHTETVLIFWFCSKERSIHFWMNLSIRTLINQVSPQRVSVVRMPTDSTVFCLFSSYLILWKLAVVLYYQITRNIKKKSFISIFPPPKKTTRLLFAFNQPHEHHLVAERCLSCIHYLTINIINPLWPSEKLFVSSPIWRLRSSAINVSKAVVVQAESPSNYWAFFFLSYLNKN